MSYGITIFMSRKQKKMNKKHNRKGKTYSIWLMPHGKCANSVSRIINDISKKYNTPIFKPHVTLIGDCEKEKCYKLYSILKKKKKIIQPIKIILKDFGYKNSFFQCLYIKVTKSYQLCKTRDFLIKNLKINSKKVYEPHMSIIYSNLKISEKKKIVKKLKTFRDYFIADKLFLAVNDYDNLNWKVIEKIKI